MMIYFYMGGHTTVSEGWITDWLHTLDEDEGIISIAWEILQ